jgi:alpha-mannosidase
MHDKSSLIQARIERFVRDRIRPALYRRTAPVEISAWQVPDEPVPFTTAVDASYSSFSVGAAWGAPWSTTWFRVNGVVPADWNEEGTIPELVVDLGFSPLKPSSLVAPGLLSAAGFQAEATAYTPDGRIIKAIEPLNMYVPVDGAGATVDLYIEAAANPNVAADFAFSRTALGDKATAGSSAVYQLRTLQLAQRDIVVWELLQDVRTLTGLMLELPATQPRRSEILQALDRMVDAVDPGDVAGTAAAGRAVLADVLAKPANASAHQVSAVGHAHIDSAWLWPVRETVRKVARTFSNVLALMDEDPDFVFAASSAQQYAWLQEQYPELFERVKAQVAAGRFVPVGGMWVESDANMPGGEAMVRQFVAGKRFFMEELGVEPREVWLPDSFGYSGALPQIFAAAGAKWFLTQKLSWNETNRMPHHTFLWEGIDGSKIFTHFPSVDTYSSELSGLELARAERIYSERGLANRSLAPFGWGDGGGGPTREMLAAAARTHDLEGSPRVTLSTPQQFFEAAEAEYVAPPVWSGELYLELHRGTYTSQAETKRGNRRSEHLLREAELWAVTAAVLQSDEYPYDELEAAWKTVLLQQFHDILPGSSIAWVHQEAERHYAEVADVLTQQIERSIASLAGHGEREIFFNAGPYSRDGVLALGGASPATAASTGSVSEVETGFVLENARVRIEVDRRGLLVSIYDRDAEREVLPEGAVGNLLQLFRDTPNQWDAWDIDEHYQHAGTDLEDAETVELSGDSAVRVVRVFGRSRIVQELSLNDATGALDIATWVDWHESEKLLKLAFPLDVLAERAASETQFGHVFRSTHVNTSWDAARFETVAHRWVHVGEPGYGVSVANDASYGHDIRRTTLPSGANATTIRVSLLRASLYPDPAADQGEHNFTVSLRVGAGIPEAVEDGYRVNLPMRRVLGAREVEPLFSVDTPAAVIESVKLAEDRSGDVIVRLYEAFGTRARATIATGFAWGRVVETDLLERTSDPVAITTESENSVGLVLRPFQLVTLRFVRGVQA